MKFINLRNYSENTLLKSSINVKDLVKRAKDEKLKAIAVSDTTGYGMVSFFNACKEEDIKPLFGFNLKFQGGLHNILLYPTSDEGKINIFNIITDFNTEKITSLSEYKTKNINRLKDVIFIVDYKTYQMFPEYYNFINKENLFIELQIRNTKDDFSDLLKTISINNIIITSPVYYLDKIFVQNFETFLNDKGEEEKQIIFQKTGNEIIKILKSIQTGLPISGISEDFDGLHFKNDDEIRQDFDYLNDSDFNHILNNINQIVERINFNLQIGVPQIPVFEIEGEERKIYDENKDKSPCLSSDEWYLRYLTYQGFNVRYDYGLTKDQILMLLHKEYDPDLGKSLTECSIHFLKELSKEHWSKEKVDFYEKSSKEIKELIDRTEYELIVMHAMGFDAYFLIVADYINWSRDNGGQVGPGRGSAAGSMVAFLTGITDIDPFQFDLLFERFLNPSRVSLPDIDTDFSHRDDVIQYCTNKYGAEYVTPVITFGKITAKTAIKGVGKSIGIPFTETNRITKPITLKESAKSLDFIYENNYAFKEMIDSSNEYKNIFDISKPITGLKQRTGKHACAVIIAPKPVTNFCPLQFPTDQKGNIKERDVMVTQLDGGDLEAQGLLKMDFLGLVNLTSMNNTINIIKENLGKVIDIRKVDINDIKVYETIFQSGKTTNVFQFESGGMKKYLKELKPNNLDDLIAMVSLYRPGPIAFIQTYINRKHGIEKIEYDIPILEKSMNVTYGICVSGDTKITMSDNSQKKIKEIVENNENLGVEVKSFNKKLGQFENKKIKHLFNNGIKDFYEVQLLNNNKIKTTKEHKFVVLDINGEIIKKELQYIDIENDLILEVIK